MLAAPRSTPWSSSPPSWRSPANLRWCSPASAHPDHRGRHGPGLVPLGRAEWITRRLPRTIDGGAPAGTPFTEAARHDFIQAASYLVIGAAAAAALHVIVPDWLMEHLAGQLLLGVLVMAVLAVVLSLCSEADAFVAASLTMVPWFPAWSSSSSARPSTSSSSQCSRECSVVPSRSDSPRNVRGGHRGGNSRRPTGAGPRRMSREPRTRCCYWSGSRPP